MSRGWLEQQALNRVPSPLFPEPRKLSRAEMLLRSVQRCRCAWHVRVRPRNPGAAAWDSVCPYRPKRSIC